MKKHQILINFLILTGTSVLLNLIPVKGLAHAPEFHQIEENTSESTENPTENPEPQNDNNSEDDLNINIQETEDNVLPASNEVDNSVNDSTQNSLKTVWHEALIIWIIINPFFLYYLKSRFSIKKTSKPSLLQ
ncbi:MAG: hypothetical protein WBA77_06345 [Microcoleaceae cyanobacterium]